ncbi:hypothetical protein VNO78_08815 [Psophocarpus tetragonolobus]|uniref:Uncharacterized protein n=1 Tax=Psophocarpus tetragonolobus TaxID=3891 RepID=A0AAN9SXQ8_PSOTE
MTHTEMSGSAVVPHQAQESDDTNLTGATNQASKTHIEVSKILGPKATRNKPSGAKQNHAQSRKDNLRPRKNSHTLAKQRLYV